MALATQCPHCQTTFRVVHDQLKLRAGLVRCGSCKQIFNGIEHLLRPDQIQHTAEQGSLHRPSPSTGPVKTFVEDRPEDQVAAESPVGNGNAIDFSVFDEHPESLPPSAPASNVHADNNELHLDSNDPLQRMTLMDFTRAEEQDDNDGTAHPEQSHEDDHVADPHTGEADPFLVDPLEQAIEDLQQKPWRSENTSTPHDRADDLVAAESDEPAFVTQGRRRQRRGRMLRVSMWVASAFLLLALAGQTTYLFRNQLAASFPEVKPVLVGACGLLDCQITLPSKIDSVSIESSELQALAPQKNMFALTLLLRNYSATAQAWPNIELTLSDANEKVLVRRIFTPHEYLPATQDIGKGLASNNEQPVKIPFELLQMKASGYRVYLYYP